MLALHWLVGLAVRHHPIFASKITGHPHPKLKRTVDKNLWSMFDLHIFSVRIQSRFVRYIGVYSEAKVSQLMPTGEGLKSCLCARVSTGTGGEGGGSWTVMGAVGIDWYVRPGPHESRYFWNRKMFYTQRLSVHKKPVNPLIHLCIKTCGFNGIRIRVDGCWETTGFRRVLAWAASSFVLGRRRGAVRTWARRMRR